MNRLELTLNKKTNELIDAKIGIDSIDTDKSIEIHMNDTVYKTDHEGEPDILIKGITFFTCSINKIEVEE